MRAIGKVELIINNKLLLISSSDKLSRNQVVMVFDKLENENIKSNYNLDFLSIPKGEVAVEMHESNNLYLCTVFTPIKEKKKFIIHPSSFDKIYGGALQSLFGTTKEEIIEETESNPSAILDNEKSLGFVLKKEITVGDLVGIF